MARALLTGIRLFRTWPYPTHEATDLSSGLGWTLPQMDATRARQVDVHAAWLALGQSRRAQGEAA